jgi:hypothetical protein
MRSPCGLCVCESASPPWNKAPIWGLRPDFCYCQKVAGLLMWGAPSDERTGLSFTIAEGPRQRSHSRVRVCWDSWPYFTVSDWRLPWWWSYRLESESYVTTDGQPASLSWNKAPFWGLRPDLYYRLKVEGLLICGALSVERTGLSFTIAAGPRQGSHFRVRVPWDSWPYATVSDPRLPFSSPPTTRRVTVEVFEPASTRVFSSLIDSKSKLCYDRRSAGQSVLEQSTHGVRIEVTKSKCPVTVFHEPAVSESCVNSLSNRLVF